MTTQQTTHHTHEAGLVHPELCRHCGKPMTSRLTADEIIEAWRKGRISASLRDGMLRAEGYELAKDHTTNIPTFATHQVVAARTGEKEAAKAQALHDAQALVERDFFEAGYAQVDLDDSRPIEVETTFRDVTWYRIPVIFSSPTRPCSACGARTREGLLDGEGLCEECSGSGYQYRVRVVLEAREPGGSWEQLTDSLDPESPYSGYEGSSLQQAMEAAGAAGQGIEDYTGEQQRLADDAAEREALAQQERQERAAQPPSTSASTDEIVGWLEQQPDATDALQAINEGYPASEALGTYLADRSEPIVGERW